MAMALVLAALPLASQAREKISLNSDEQVLLKQVQSDRRAIYADNLDLTEAESASFWPIYDRYEAEREKLDARLVALVNDFAAKYDKMTDAEALKLLDEKLTIERKQLELRDEYTRKIADALPGRKALRYAQIESRITNLMRRNLYTIVPLAR
ncbi:MAG: hypothetical protein FIB04_06955 [Gammaproteobacteria bacterium]|nr:hypothetical protein [Gammaproteobacteria bacterium]